MISYFQAARELDARWTNSLQFLPSTPTLRNEQDCVVARQIASTEVDLFNRYAREIAVAYGLKLGVLVECYDMLLSTGLMLIDDLDEGRAVCWLPSAPEARAAVASVQDRSRKAQAASHASPSGVSRFGLKRS